MRISRRAFVVGAAAGCVACRSNDDPTPTSGTAALDDGPRPDAGDDVDAPAEVGGFGGTVDLGPVTDLASALEENAGFLYRPEARTWISRFPEASLADAEAVYGPLEDAGIVAGFVALYQKCPHLGCRVPECVSSQRFECPCHGAVFNQVGERVAGPAPRGMDRFRLALVDGRVLLDTSQLIEGAPAGTFTVTDEPAGPSCIQ